MTKLEQSLDVFMREFREMDAEADERFRMEQRRLQKNMLAWEERQTTQERNARKEEAEKQRTANRENTELLAATIRQLLQPPQAQAPQQASFPLAPQYTPNYNQVPPQNQSFMQPYNDPMQTPRRPGGSSLQAPRRQSSSSNLLHNMDTGDIFDGQ